MRIKVLLKRQTTENKRNTMSQRFSVCHHFYRGHNLPDWTKLECYILCVVLFHNCVLWPCPTSKMSATSSGWLKTWKSVKIKNFRTTIRDETKSGPSSPYLVPFQNYVLWSRLLSKMAVTTDYTTFDFPALFKVFEISDFYRSRVMPLIVNRVMCPWF